MIVLLKLNDGTELIGDVEEGEGIYAATNIAQIVTREQNGTMSIGLVPFMPYIAKNAPTLIPTNMAIIAEAGSDIVDHYTRMFSSIITPPSKIIL